MAQPAYALLRIIIIDSFWKNQVNELNLSGHTQLEGTNGAGKTSLMRLLPLFYGMRPSDIVSKVDQARNFADYYLPRDTSMLVYEYQRPNGQICMVLASSDGRGVHFKFIDGSYNSDYFIGENKKPYSVSEVDRFYRSAGCDRSNFLGIDKYRQVIQNLRSGKKLKDIRQLQNRYSFSHQACPHIEKVINGTIEKNLDFDAVKRMLVEIASDHLARKSNDEKEQISLNKEEITHWLADIQASRAIQKVADKIGVWQTEFNQLDSLLIKLQHLHFEMLAHQETLDQRLISSTETKKVSQGKLQELEKELASAITSLDKQLNDIKAKIGADQSQIDLLDEDKMRFDEDDAPSYQLKADRAPQIQNDLNTVNAIIETFEGNINNIRQKFDDLIAKLKLQSMQDLADNNHQIAQVREQASEQLVKIDATYQAQRRELDTQLNEQDIKLQLKARDLEHAQQTAREQLQHVQFEPQLIADIEANSQALSQAQEILNQQYQHQSQLQTQLATIERQRDKQLQHHQQLSRYIEQLQTEYSQVEQQLVPITGSLHHFLDNEPLAADWKNNIGRLLSSEQLARRDLDPKWMGGDGHFYGLSIDLQHVQTNDSLFLNELELREKCDLLDNKLQAEKQKESQLDEHISQLSKQIDALKYELTLEAQKLQQNQLNLTQLKTQQQNLAVKKQLAIKSHTESVSLQLKSIEADQKAILKKRQLFIEDSQEQQNELHNQLLEKRMVIESDRDVQLSQLHNDRAQLEESQKLRLKELSKQKNADIAKIDPDGEVDKRIRERTELTLALQLCTEFEQKARKYQHFMNNRYCHRDALVEENQKRHIQIRNIEFEREDIHAQLTSDIESERKTIKKCNELRLHTQERLSQIADCVRQCDLLGIKAQEHASEPSNQADLCISFFNDWSVQFKAVEKRLTSQLNTFNERFRKDHAASELFENWQKLVADNDIFEGAQGLFKYRQPIADLLSSAEQKQKSTYQLVTVNASMINEFYQHIENFGHRIKKIGKALSHNVTELVHFEALADINVTTVMKQEELEYWSPLKKFAETFESYRDQLREGIGEIPDDLVYAMKTLSAYLPSDGFALSHSNLFDIEFAITENGQVKHARNARQLKKVSSTGLSYLAMLSLFAGILGMLRGESSQASQIILPVDELGELAAENIGLLLKMFDDNHISILSASPSTDRHILALYDRHYKLKDHRIYYAQIPQSRLDQLLAQRVKNNTHLDDNQQAAKAKKDDEQANHESQTDRMQEPS